MTDITNSIFEVIEPILMWLYLHPWISFLLLGAIFAFVFVFLYLLQRYSKTEILSEEGIKDYVKISYGVLAFIIICYILKFYSILAIFLIVALLALPGLAATFAIGLLYLFCHVIMLLPSFLLHWNKEKLGDATMATCVILGLIVFVTIITGSWWTNKIENNLKTLLVEKSQSGLLPELFVNGNNLVSVTVYYKSLDHFNKKEFLASSYIGNKKIEEVGKKYTIHPYERFEVKTVISNKIGKEMHGGSIDTLRLSLQSLLNGYKHTVYVYVPNVDKMGSSNFYSAEYCYQIKIPLQLIWDYINPFKDISWSAIP